MSKPKTKIKVTYKDGTERIFESQTALCKEYSLTNSYLSIVLLRGYVPEKWQFKHGLKTIERL